MTDGYIFIPVINPKLFGMHLHYLRSSSHPPNTAVLTLGFTIRLCHNKKLLYSPLSKIARGIIRYLLIVFVMCHMALFFYEVLTVVSSYNTYRPQQILRPRLLRGFPDDDEKRGNPAWKRNNNRATGWSHPSVASRMANCNEQSRSKNNRAKVAFGRWSCCTSTESATPDTRLHPTSTRGIINIYNHINHNATIPLTGDSNFLSRFSISHSYTVPFES